jgi:hypothetical protein
MKPITVTVSIPAEAFVSQLSTAEGIADGPDPVIAELHALDHYAGRWVGEITGKPDLKRTEVAEWILDGRFLRQCWSTEGIADHPKASGITISTFDAKTARYLSWSFLAIGSVVHNQGTWDETSRTMTWTDQLDGTGDSVVTKSTFADGGINVWSIVERNPKGDVLREVDGKSIRRSA